MQIRGGVTKPTRSHISVYSYRRILSWNDAIIIIFVNNFILYLLMIKSPIRSFFSFVKYFQEYGDRSKPYVERRFKENKNLPMYNEKKRRIDIQNKFKVL